MASDFDKLIKKYIESLPPPSPAMKKAAEAMGKLLKEKIDQYKETSRLLHEAIRGEKNGEEHRMTDKEDEWALAIWNEFMAVVQEARDVHTLLDMDLQAMNTPQYDEPYKLGPNPDIEAIREAKRLMQQAQKQMAKFFKSTTNYPS